MVDRRLSMRISTIVVALVAAAIVAVGRSASEPAAPAKILSPGVADIMIATQVRHAKLWLAGAVRNWELAEYQIDELKEGLEDIVKYYPVYKEIPVGAMIEETVMKPIAEVEAAVKARDRARFAAAYDRLTAACNACHVSSNRPFIVMRRPSGSAFPSQLFVPRR
jgi:hypothetical protein